MSKTTLSGIIGGLFSLLAFAAAVPTELQKLIMDCVPTTAQPYISLIFASAAFAAKWYQSHYTADSPSGPKATNP